MQQFTGIIRTIDNPATPGGRPATNPNIAHLKESLADSRAQVLVSSATSRHRAEPSAVVTVLTNAGLR